MIAHGLLSFSSHLPSCQLRYHWQPPGGGNNKLPDLCSGWILLENVTQVYGPISSQVSSSHQSQAMETI